MNEKWKMLRPEKSEDDSIVELIERCRRNEAATIDFVVPAQSTQGVIQQTPSENSSDDQYIFFLANEIKAKIDSIFQNSSKISDDGFHFSKRDIVTELLTISNIADELNTTINDMCNAKNYFNSMEQNGNKELVNGLITLN